jgi:hypothetical protein
VNCTPNVQQGPLFPVVPESGAAFATKIVTGTGWGEAPAKPDVFKSRCAVRDAAESAGFFCPVLAIGGV